MLFKGNSSSLQLIIEKLQSNKEQYTQKDTLGTEGGSSWVSEDHTTSPGSSCATPTSATEAPDSELSFTVGVTDGTPHACRFCEKAFPRHSYLKKHEQTHADCMPFRCEYCGRLFKHKRSRDRHIKLHTGDKKYRCSLCDTAFSRSDHLKIHMKTHDNQKPFQCTVCNRGYNTAAALTSHMQNHKRSSENTTPLAPPGTTFKCLQCPEVFRKPEDLQNHMNTHQSENINGSGKASKNTFPPIRLICNYCHKDNFSTMDALQSHVQSAHKSIFNGELQLDFTNPITRQKSPVSSQPSPQSNSSPLHSIQSFSSLPPSYYCELCTMKFLSSQALQKHKNCVHGFYNNTMSNIKNFVLPEMCNKTKLLCSFCSIQFSTPTAFAEHYIVFHNPYPGFFSITPPEQMKPTDLSKKSSLKRNNANVEDTRKIMKKTGEHSSLDNTYYQYEHTNVVICNQCNASFNNFESFRAHIKLHIDETSSGLLGGGTSLDIKRNSSEFTCPQCRSVFSSSEEISQHVVTHFLSTVTEYSCENCQKSFEKATDLQKHLVETHAQHLYSCSICNEVFDSKVSIQIHFSVRHSNEAKGYRCTGCPASTIVYHSELEFATHVKTVHTNNSSLLTTFTTHHNTQTLRCFVCHMSFVTELDFQLHLATHGKKFQCNLCPQSFQIEYLLDKHIESHHSSQQINGTHENCYDSSMKELSPILSPNTRFDNHSKKTENGEKGNFFYCDICEKQAFTTDSELLNHKKVFHHKASSPGKHDNLENNDGGKLQKQKSASTSSSPTMRFENKKSENLNGDSNSNNSTSCEICEKRDFVSEAELASHKKLIHHSKLSSPGKVSLHCAYCNENCKSRSDLENHMKNHSQNSTTTGKHKCIICDEMCPTAAVLAEHKLTHCKVLSGKTCMHCKGSITTEEQFYSHIQQHSTAQPGNNNNNTQNQLILPTVCVICRQTLISEMEARMHARFHLHKSPDLVPCTVCFQMFDKLDLVAGICKECYQRHGKSSPFRCPECHVKFENGTSIEHHLATVHRKNFQCIKCQVNFDSEKEIQQHVATHLLMDGINAHECRICRIVFPSPLQLQAHLIEHTFAGCSTYTCYICSCVFTTAPGLQNHMLEHGLSARPYDCRICKQKFFFSAELEHHNQVHREEMLMSEGHNYFYGQDKNALKDKISMQYGHSITMENVYSKNQKYSCVECGVDFTHANDLYDHKNRFHGQKETYTQNGEHNRQTPSAESKDKFEEQNDEKSEKEDNCESEDEQIDVVTTKMEDQPDNIKKEG